jgi:hypothetical protein
MNKKLQENDSKQKVATFLFKESFMPETDL